MSDEVEKDAAKPNFMASWGWIVLTAALAGIPLYFASGLAPWTP